ncbi:MAG: ABC transporter substrate-binding protein [Oscillospiraceae bacterium]
MKKLLSLFCTLSRSAALLAGCSGGNGNTNATADGAESTSPTLTEPETTTQQETSAPVDVNVMALKGPTAMGMVEFMSQADTGELTDNNYHFSITAVTDEVSAALAQGTTDLAAVPANLASVLYNNTEGGVQVWAINTLGVLYIVESGDTVHSVEDLRGKTIYASGRGNTPEYALNYVLTQNGIDPASDVTIEWKSEQAECLSALMAEENTIAMLPQPFVTTAQTKSENIRVALDRTEEWDEIQAESDAPSTLVTGVVVGRTEFVAEHPEAVSAFLEHYRASVEYVNANVDEAAQLVGQYAIVAAEVAQKALPECNIVFIEGVEMKDGPLLGIFPSCLSRTPNLWAVPCPMMPSTTAAEFSWRRPRTIRAWAVPVWLALWQLGAMAISKREHHLGFSAAGAVPALGVRSPHRISGGASPTPWCGSPQASFWGWRRARCWRPSPRGFAGWRSCWPPPMLAIKSIPVAAVHHPGPHSVFLPESGDPDSISDCPACTLFQCPGRHPGC